MNAATCARSRAARRSLGPGALVVSFRWRRAPFAQERRRRAAASRRRQPLPGSLKNIPLLDSWIRIDADGAITVFTGKAELGQGIKTALMQIAAEELDVDPAHIDARHRRHRAARRTKAITAGSHSMQDSGTAILNAAAQVRALLVDAAAQRLGVAGGSARDCSDGVVIAPDGRSVGYGELVAGLSLHVARQPARRR